jgi:enoyl-CoA hydratase
MGRRYLGRDQGVYLGSESGAEPTIAKVHGYAVAGGSDIALCCDLVVMAELNKE